MAAKTFSIPANSIKEQNNANGPVRLAAPRKESFDEIRKLDDGTEKDEKRKAYGEKQTELVGKIKEFYSKILTDLDGGQLILADGKLTPVGGPTTPIPSDASRFDARRRHLSPGLIATASSPAPSPIRILAHATHPPALAVALANRRADAPLQGVQTGRDGYGTLQDFQGFVGSDTTVFLLGPANPVYDTPGDEFEKALASAKQSIHLGLRTDATANACTWHVPAAHYLESWSDVRSASGVY